MIKNNRLILLFAFYINQRVNMGSYLSSVAGELKTNCKLTGLSLAKIRELHGGFKSVCDNFAINLTEFESIFQSN